MRELDPEEIVQRLAKFKIRNRRTAERASTPATEQELGAIARAEAALRLVVRDIESTTPVREPSRVQRYAEWMAEMPPNPLWQLTALPEDDGPIDDDDDDTPVLACHWGGRSFALNGDQTMLDLTLEIAGQLQDDVIDEVWGAWPPCPGHEHPMSADAVDGVAVWECPTDADVAVPIGQLNARAS